MHKGPEAQASLICCQVIGGWTVSNATDTQWASQRHRVLLIHVQHPPPQRLPYITLSLRRRSRIQIFRMSMQPNRVCQADGSTKKRPGIQKAPAVGEVRAHHDKSLDPKQSGPAHEGSHAQRLHRGSDFPNQNQNSSLHGKGVGGGKGLTENISAPGFLRRVCFPLPPGLIPYRVLPS